MSSRHFRKLVGSSLPAPDSDDSDGDFDPLAIRNNKTSTYAGLEFSSDSESDKPDKEEESEEEVITPVHGGARKKKPQKKKGKGKKNNHGHDVLACTSGTGEELDEIDKSLMEVNALLGAPPPAPVKPEPKPLDQMATIITAQAKYLNVCNELKRLFGPENPEEIRQRNKTQPHRNRLLKRVMISPTHDTAIQDFKKTGLSMSIERREGDLIFFVYDHDQDHQKMHRAFLIKYIKNFVRNGGSTFLSMDDAKKYMHVEPLLEIADTLFRMDESSLANEIVENVMTYLQYVAHPSFNLANRNVRLLYTYIENRPFHVVMLKYMYLLTNKACHRTALEIAKMLLNIDPSDPLAVLFVIDTLALRAREHRWLIDAIDFFNVQRQARMLFNIQYSYALAHFHVAFKTKSDMTEADTLLQNAIMGYPEVVVKIMEYANMNEPRIKTHSLFVIQAETAEGLSELIKIYAKLSWPRWREPHVIDWFLKNAIEVTENYNNSDDIKAHVKQLTNIRHNIFQVWPTEILRHISIIKSMANLLMETTLTVANHHTSAWDPLFDRGINRYDYRSPTDPPRNLSPTSRALLYRNSSGDQISFMLNQLLATRGRTLHAAMFDPWHTMLEFLWPTNMPADPANEDAEDENQRPRRSSESDRREVNEPELPHPFNGLMSARSIPTYPLNILNMFGDLAFDCGDDDDFEYVPHPDMVFPPGPGRGSPSNGNGNSSDAA